MRTAEQIAKALIERAEAYCTDKITYEELSAGNRADWREVQDRDLQDEVGYILRVNLRKS